MRGGQQEARDDRAREEFLSEAQELVDGLGRDLLALDEVIKKGASDAELINDVFRAVHTLKGIAGLFGAARMTGLSHELEDVLDDLRLGRVELSSRVLDAGVSRRRALRTAPRRRARGGGADPGRIRALLVALGAGLRIAGARGAAAPSRSTSSIRALGVLHRVRGASPAHEHPEPGWRSTSCASAFPLATIDSALDEPEGERAQPHKPIITHAGRPAADPDADCDRARSSHREQRGDCRHAAHRSLTGHQLAIEKVPNIHARAHVASSDTARAARSAIVRTRGQDQARRMCAARCVASLAPPIRSRFHAALGDADGPRRHSQARSPDERRRRARDRAHRADGRRRSSPQPRGDTAAMQELLRLHRSFERRLGQMQGGILEVRMVPLGQVFEKLARVVREALARAR